MAKSRSGALPVVGGGGAPSSGLYFFWVKIFKVQTDLLVGRGWARAEREPCQPLDFYSFVSQIFKEEEWEPQPNLKRVVVTPAIYPRQGRTPFLKAT